MKLFLIFLLTLIFGFGKTSSLPIKYQVKTDDVELNLSGYAHVLMDFESKQVIYADNEHERLFPASMTKMMGMVLILESINSNKISWNDEVIATNEACSMGGTQIYLEEGEKMSVEDLFKAVAINSANDAIVALGVFLKGSHEGFVKAMNSKAKEIGMMDTNFANATGFDDDSHVTSAYDMALLGRELLTYNEQVLRFTRLKEAYVREDTNEPFWLVSTNKLLGHYEGLDGLKTGFTSKAGYNLTATAMRNGIRLISVTMKADTIKDRSQDTVKLLNYGFSKVSRTSVFNSGEKVGNFTFIKAKDKDTPLYTKCDIAPTYLSEYKLEDLKLLIVITKIKAPIAKDTCVGYLEVTSLNGEKRTYPLYVIDDVVNKPYFDYLWSALGSLMV